VWKEIFVWYNAAMTEKVHMYSKYTNTNEFS